MQRKFIYNKNGEFPKWISTRSYAHKTLHHQQAVYVSSKYRYFLAREALMTDDGKTSQKQEANSNITTYLFYDILHQ